jgi:hypothetical protein
MRKRLRWALALGTALAVVAAGAAIAAKPVVVTAGNLIATLNGEVKPKALPKNKMAPITLSLSAALKTKDGSHPPAVKFFEAEFDKNGTLDPVGLPACKQGQLEARTTKAAEQACKASIVGKGSAEAEVEFAESAPFKAKGPLVVFNGGKKGGTTTLFVHVYANVPAPTAFITPVKVTKINKGKYGNKVVGTIPVIAGGAGSTIKFNVTNRKIFTYKGKKKSYFIAKCPTGRFFAQGAVKFTDGTRLQGTVIRPCTPKG